MNITMMDVYWITRLDEIKFFLHGAFFFSMITTFVFTVLYFMFNTGEGLKTQSPIKFWMPITSSIVLITLGIAQTLTPTTKEMIVIAIVPKVANAAGNLGDEVVKQVKNASKNPELQKLPNNAMSLVNAYMEEKIKDIKTK